MYCAAESGHGSNQQKLLHCVMRFMSKMRGLANFRMPCELLAYDLQCSASLLARIATFRGLKNKLVLQVRGVSAFASYIVGALRDLEGLPSPQTWKAPRTPLEDLLPFTEANWGSFRLLVWSVPLLNEPQLQIP